MQICTGIACTTRRDRSGIALTKECLNDGVRQFNSKYIPFLVDHDFEKQLGVVLYGELFELPDGESALGYVAGIYEAEDEKLIYASGEPNLTVERFKREFDLRNILEVWCENQKATKDDESEDCDLNLGELLDRYMTWTQVDGSGNVYEIRGLVQEYKGMKLYVRSNDHAPAHFHVVSVQREYEVKFDLNSLELIGEKYGSISQSDLRKVQSFVRNNMYGSWSRLKSEWAQLNPEVPI